MGPGGMRNVGALITRIGVPLKGSFKGVCKGSKRVLQYRGLNN